MAQQTETRLATRQEIKPDICVIGASAAGQAAAAAAAAFGVNVVLIGKDGANSVDEPVLSTNALVAAAGSAAALRGSAHFGADYIAARAHVRDVVAAVAPRSARERLRGLGIRVIDGAARFADRTTVAVNGFDIKARRFVIATGSSPALPAIPGLAETPHLTGESVFALADCPRHLIVVGAGSAGLELAQAFRRLGAEVTVIDEAAPLAQEDRECAAIVLDALAREGVTLRSGVTIARVRRGPGQVLVDFAGDGGEETIAGSHLLIAAGRRPNLEDLDLDAAGIRHAPHGIVVDRRLRTSNKQVYAIGDVVDGPRLADLGHHHAGLVVRNALFRTPVRTDSHAVPAVTYTDPELAQVGPTEDEARALHGVIRVLRAPYRENDRALATGATNGHIKVVTDRNGTILGVTIVGAQAAESVAAWTLAINQGLNIEAMAGVIVPYPSYAEVGKRAAMTYFTGGLTSPLVRRIIGWLRRFG